ncbi:hypothetical protein HRR83_007861 [Exophiala dermatitidis]|nr:hypothetical protein HRR76_003960 [Exophiala dermatitidis]KAJ4590847.1 hypothetical protein HRR83_007861 [Exophiala dermatitidis]KAJ4617080.1 hypothetical protein HRR86_007441 [Exophiala dermatitidis]KAJ4624466.1 hypothetical protein HRR88_005061 [Exophiala dermatitidis]KAJ4671395.1 hypothetical protein HRR92_006070 [Exophiala dermatitidis]
MYCVLSSSSLSVKGLVQHRRAMANISGIQQLLDGKCTNASARFNVNHASQSVGAREMISDPLSSFDNAPKSNDLPHLMSISIALQFPLFCFSASCILLPTTLVTPIHLCS